MSIGATKTDVYTDFKGLTELRLNAESKPEETLRAAGRHFEALFIQMMLKSMRDASPGDPLMGGGGQELYRDMFDKQISLTLSEKGSLGLAEAMVRQLRQHLPEADAAPAGAASSTALPQRPNAGIDAATAASSPAAAAHAAPGTTSFDNPDQFAAAMWPAAQAAGRELGVDPRVLIAQAALETGWGRSVMRQAEGGSSHNLFGIKAGVNWHGPSVNVATLEYRDGVAVKERANFRAYGSYAESFADYVDFIKSQPRYREALTHAGDPQRYLNELQNAGYATDPRYADKIGNILRGEVLAGLSGDSIGSGGGPIV